ncbi:hypothetical protein [Streptomyces sp. NPDC087270]|uniref:hypothetical protein n=1 Tax=Streptomyces sp. NPDC087270 TaxID=3365774 RepID=UPI00382E773B
MEATLTLNYPAPIAAGHEIEVTEFADTRPEKKRSRWYPAWDQPFRHPVILDVTTGIRYMNHMHVHRGDNGGNCFAPNDYPLEPRTDLPVRRVYRARVKACALVMVEGLDQQHTKLVVDVLGPAGPGGPGASGAGGPRGEPEDRRPH